MNRSVSPARIPRRISAAVPQALRGLRTARALALLLLLLLSACGDGTPVIEPLSPDARVLAFGDSLTHGTGAGDGESYPEVLGTLIDREVVNAGVPGEETTAGRERLPRVLDREQPDLLILCHGGNDILRDRDGDAMRSNLVAMIEMARGRGIDVVLIGVPERSLFLDIAEQYEDVAAELSVPLEDEALAEILGSPELKSDRIHPNAAGYRELAAAVHALLERTGAVQS